MVVDKSGECPVKTRLRMEMDLPGLAIWGSVAIRKRWKRHR